MADGRRVAPHAGQPVRLREQLGDLAAGVLDVEQARRRARLKQIFAVALLLPRNDP